ncbi:MAG: methyltransferase domain-containing protein [Gammaproteobacteria bacterium]|nr:methyltransferase domain-containing protein [Gammaproteobacteria bacterium]
MGQALSKEQFSNVNLTELEQHVKNMYRDVAQNPQGDFHFEMGRIMAERLGYQVEHLDLTPQQAIESFAGVGYYFDLLDLKPKQKVVDFGSGAGMDTFVAAIHVGQDGIVTGIDMTDEQLDKANRLSVENGFINVSYRKAYIDKTGLENNSQDAVISNGVINLAADKQAVFNEAYRVLKQGGKLALADIVTESRLPENITCDATLWAACIGGAMQQDDYINTIKTAGFEIIHVQDNPEYHFISDGATWATETFGVKSISLLAIKK